jgi:hypothetical protein
MGDHDDEALSSNRDSEISSLMKDTNSPPSVSSSINLLPTLRSTLLTLPNVDLMTNKIKGEFSVLVNNYNRYINLRTSGDVSSHGLLSLLQHHLILLNQHKALQKEKKLRELFFNKSLIQKNNHLDEGINGLFGCGGTVLDNIFCNRNNWMLIFSYLAEFG